MGLVLLNFERSGERIWSRINCGTVQVFGNSQYLSKLVNFVTSALFFDDHSHCTQFTGEISPIIGIIARVIQGLAIGPADYVDNAFDLRPINAENKLFKFADDTYLLIPGANSHTCECELKHVSDWAESNNLELNQSKSLEIVITAPGVSGTDTRVHTLSTIQDIEWVNKLTVLGVKWIKPFDLPSELSVSRQCSSWRGGAGCCCGVC